MKKICFLASMVLFFLFTTMRPASPMYICTSADSDYYNYLINLIDTVHQHNFDNLGQIAVFDLGFTKDQRKELQRIQKVTVYDVRMVHPDLLTHFRVSNYGKKVRGWYAWKPVVMKQFLDRFPYMLYMDAALMVLGPLDQLFEHIKTHGYLVAGCGHSIQWMCPKHVIQTFDLHADERRWILDETTEGIAGGFMGMTKEVAHNFLFPLYKLAHDLKHFVDDGTTPNGFGTARHDQVLFSIQARLLGLDVPSWNDQARLVIDGRRVACLCRDIVIRTHNVVAKEAACHRGGRFIRQHIQYK